MKKILLFLFILLANINSNAQKYRELGYFAGVSYYMGDLNTQHFYSPQLSFGLLLRHNLNSRWAVRTNLYGGQLTANDNNSKYKYQQIRNYNFSTIYIELNSQIEFNFLPYRFGDENTPFTPYIALGIGGAYFTNSIKPLQITIPFAFGFKFNLNEFIGIGIAWNMRKTFTDYIDNLTNNVIESENYKIPPKQIGYNRHNDWYSNAGIFITFKAFNGKNKCKAYNY
jgi:hypothetical protein